MQGLGFRGLGVQGFGFMEIVEGLGAKKFWPTVFTRLHAFFGGNLVSNVGLPKP